MLKVFAKASTTKNQTFYSTYTGRIFKISGALKIATKLKCWGFFHCLCLSEKDLREGGVVREGDMDLTGEWGTSRVREWEHGVGGLHREGKGTSLSAPLEGWNSSRAVPPHLADTCENNSPAFSHSADPIAISTLEGTRVRGNPDRQNTERERERSFNRVGQMPRPVERLHDINILWRLSGRASSPSCVVLCLCVAAAAIAVAKWRTCEHARAKDSTFHIGDFPRCFGPKKDGKDWEE